MLSRVVGMIGVVCSLFCPFGVPETPTGAPDRIHGQAGDGSLYSIQAGLQGEIYPVFANYASLQRQDQRRFAVVRVTVSNPTPASLRPTVSVQIPGWSDQEIQVAELEPGATRTLMFAPTFLPRFYKNPEIVASTPHLPL